VSETLQTALSFDTETAHRFNDYFSSWVDTAAGTLAPSQKTADGAPLPFDPPTLRVRVWPDRTGQVRQVLVRARLARTAVLAEAHAKGWDKQPQVTADRGREATRKRCAKRAGMTLLYNV